MRTTVTIPEDIYMQTRILAAYNKKSFSSYLSGVLQEKVKVSKKKKKLQDPFLVAGKFSIGIGKIYKKRSELYENRLEKTMGN